MKAFSLRVFGFLFCSCLLAASCDKNNSTESSSGVKAPLSIEFDNIAGNQNLQLNTGKYRTSFGEEFSVDLLQYFISNVVLTRSNGERYVVPQDSCYFLIKEANPESRFARMNIPEGDYVQLEFLLGVDSARSTMGIDFRTGVLDPSGGMDGDGMYWGWNSGYIFFKMEGSSPNLPIDPSGQRKFRYHIGGFGGYNVQNINNIKKIVLDLRAGGIPQVRVGRTANVHLMVDILKAFNGNTPIELAKNPSVMFSEFSRNVANNYVDMFRHDHTEN